MYIHFVLLFINMYNSTTYNAVTLHVQCTCVHFQSMCLMPTVPEVINTIYRLSPLEYSPMTCH